MPDETPDRDAATIGASQGEEPEASSADPDAAWPDMTGWLVDGGVDDIDDEVYGTGSASSAS